MSEITEFSEKKAPLESADNPKSPNPGTAGKSRWRFLTEQISPLLLAVAFVFGFRSSVIEPFKIPSGSMMPTLLIGDHIFVNKLAYAVKLPFSDWFGSKPIYLYRRSTPQRGDIVVFLYPKNEDIYYIKRIVGIPGDRIEVRDKVLYVNDKAIPREPITGPQLEEILKSIQDDKYNSTQIEAFREKMEHGSPVTLLDQNSYHTRTFGPVTVPEGQYFAMGDNRDASNDSRFWGFVPFDNIKGRATIIWASFWVEWGESYIFRANRIGHSLN